MTMIDQAPDREARYLLEERGLLGGSGTLFLFGHDVAEWHEGFLSRGDIPKAIRGPTKFVQALRKLNGEGVDVKRAIDVNIVELLRYRRILFDERGLAELMARLQSDRGLLGSPLWPLRLADDPEAEEEEDDPLGESNEQDEEESEEEEAEVQLEALRLVQRARKLGGIEEPEPRYYAGEEARGAGERPRV